MSNSIHLDPVTSLWLQTSIKAHGKAMFAVIARESFELLLNLGYVTGEPEACSPTARAYQWQTENELSIRLAKNETARKRKKKR